MNESTQELLNAIDCWGPPRCGNLTPMVDMPSEEELPTMPKEKLGELLDQLLDEADALGLKSLGKPPPKGPVREQRGLGRQAGTDEPGSQSFRRTPRRHPVAGQNRPHARGRKQNPF